jgi:hypothetical protein
VKEHHDLADDLLLSPGSDNTAGAHSTDACYLSQTLRLRLDRIEHLLAESAHLAYTGPMPRIIPEPRYFSMPSSDIGAEAFKNFAIYRSPWLRSDPFARCGDLLAGRDHRGIPYHRDQFAVAAHLDPQTQKPFSSLWYVTRSIRPASTRWSRLHFHADRRINCFAAARANPTA